MNKHAFTFKIRAMRCRIHYAHNAAASEPIVPRGAAAYAAQKDGLWSALELADINKRLRLVPAARL